MTSYYTIAHQDVDGGMHYPRWIDADDFVITDDELVANGKMLTTRDIRESSVWTSREAALAVAARANKLPGDAVYEPVKLSATGKGK